MARIQHLVQALAAHGVDQALHAQGLHGSQLIGTLFDGVARHTREGYTFQALAARDGFRAAVRARDEPFGDPGRRVPEEE